MQRWDGRIGVAERRLDGAIAYSAVVRYDALRRAVGAPVELASRCSTPAARAWSSRRSCTATRRASTRSSCARASPSTSSPRRRPRRSRPRSPRAASPTPLDPGPGAPARRLPRSRRHVLRRGAARLGPAGAARGRCRCATLWETIMAVERGDGRPRAWCRSRTRSRAPVPATLDALAVEATGVRIAAEVVHPIHHCLIAGAPAGARADRARRVPPPGHRPVRALPARAAAEAGPRERAPPRPRPCGIVVADRGAMGGARLAAGRRDPRRRGAASRASRITPTTPRASSGSPRGTAARGDRARGHEDLGRVLGLQRHVPRRARARCWPSWPTGAST